MEAILNYCCGLDVHRDTIVACLLKEPFNRKHESTIREFSALPYDLKQLRDWLIKENYYHVARKVPEFIGNQYIMY